MDVERTIEFILEQQARTEANLARTTERLDSVAENLDRTVDNLDRMSGRLDRAIRLGVQEARAERRKRRELDEKLTQLAAAQLVTEEKVQNLSDTVQAYLKGRRNGGNGQPSA